MNIHVENLVSIVLLFFLLFLVIKIITISVTRIFKTDENIKKVVKEVEKIIYIILISSFFVTILIQTFLDPFEKYNDDTGYAVAQAEKIEEKHKEKQIDSLKQLEEVNKESMNEYDSFLKKNAQEVE